VNDRAGSARVGGVCTKARVEAEQIDITHASDVHMSTQLER